MGIAFADRFLGSPDAGHEVFVSRDDRSDPRDEQLLRTLFRRIELLDQLLRIEQT